MKLCVCILWVVGWITTHMKVMLHKGLQNRTLTLVWECLYKENRNGLAYTYKETTKRCPRSSYIQYSYFNMSSLLIMLLISVLKTMFFSKPDKSHFHTTALPFLTHCSNVKKSCQSHLNWIRHNIKTFNILPPFLETLQHSSWQFYLVKKKQNLLDINYDCSNYFSNLNWPEIFFWKNYVFTNLFWITMEMGLLCIADVQGWATVLPKLSK